MIALVKMELEQRINFHFCISSQAHDQDELSAIMSQVIELLPEDARNGVMIR